MKYLFFHLFSKIDVSSLSCDVCMRTKQHQVSFLSQSYKPTQSFTLIHSDVWGPSKVIASSGKQWFVTFIDDHTRLTWVFLITDKLEVSSIFQNFYRIVETQFNAKTSGKTVTFWNQPVPLCFLLPILLICGKMVFLLQLISLIGCPLVSSTFRRPQIVSRSRIPPPTLLLRSSFLCLGVQPIFIESLSPHFRAFTASLDFVVILKNVHIALECPEWKTAVMEEMRAFEKNKTWEICTLSK